MARSWMILFLLIASTAQAAFIPFDAQDAHDELLGRSEGFFKLGGGTGGQGGQVVYVTTLANSGPGSLRSYMKSTETLIILFEDGLNGTINLLEHIKVKSNKTLWGRHRDGTGADILIRPANTKAAFTINGENRNVIFSNLKADANFGINDSAPDWLRISGDGGTVWVDHIIAIGDGTQDMDGFVDTHAGNVTLSWNYVRDWDNVHLLYPDVEPVTVTLHHNLFINNHARMPRLSQPGYAHAFNNWLVGWTASGMQAINGGELYADFNIFEATDDDDAILGSWDGDGNVFLAGAVTDPRDISIPGPPYDYAPDIAGDTLKVVLLANAGWQDFAIPEPVSGLLFVFGVLWFGRRGRKKGMATT